MITHNELAGDKFVLENKTESFLNMSAFSLVRLVYLCLRRGYVNYKVV